MHTGPDIGVIGGGILGLTAALRFVQAGARVTVIEREDRVGGLVASFEIGGCQLERFYHHLFRSDVDVQNLIAEVGLGDELVWPQPDTSSYYQGKIYSLDSATDVLRFSPLPLAGRLRLGAAWPTSRSRGTTIDSRARRRPPGSGAGWAKMCIVSSGGHSCGRSSATTQTRSPCPGSGPVSTCGVSGSAI